MIDSTIRSEGHATCSAGALASALPEFPVFFVSGMKIQNMPNAKVATPARKRNAALKPARCTMNPVMPLESDAPKPVAVATTPCVKLNRPVPRVRSAITSTLTTPKIAAPMPSIKLYADKKIRIVGERIERAADGQCGKADEEYSLAPPRAREVPGRQRHWNHYGLRANNADGHVERRSSRMASRQFFPDERQHRRVRKMKEHNRDRKDQQGSIHEHFQKP